MDSEIILSLCYCKDHKRDAEYIYVQFERLLEDSEQNYWAQYPGS